MGESRYAGTRGALVAVLVALTVPTAGCPEEAGRLPFAVTLQSVDPLLLRPGEPVTVLLEGSIPLERCAVFLGTRAARCSLTPTRACACRLDDTSSLADGPQTVQGIGWSFGRKAEATGEVFVDAVRPTIEQALLEIVRNPIGVDDLVRTSPGAVVDVGRAYPSRAVIVLRLEDEDGRIWFEGPPGADGSIGDLVLTGTEQSTPAQIWASATDAVGNQSPRVEILSGRDLEGPSIDRAAIWIDVIAGGAAMTVAGAAGAVVDQVTPIRLLELRTDPADGAATPLVLDLEGGFAPTAATSPSVTEVWVAATDKAGHLSVARPSRVRLELLPDDPGFAVFEVDASEASRSPHALALEGASLPPTALAGRDGSSLPSELAPGPPRGPAWTETSQGPSGESIAMVHDRARGLMVLVDQQTRETFEFDGAQWIARQAIVGSPGTLGLNLVYDEARRRTVSLLDPADGGPMETWEYDGASWTLALTVPEMPRREFMLLAYDSTRQVVVGFGSGGWGAPQNDTWEYDGVAWSLREPAHRPAIVDSGALVFDRRREQVVLSSQVRTGGVRMEQWTWDGDDWLEVVPTTKPSVREGFGLAYDEARDRIVLFGGATTGHLADTWEFDGVRWREIVTPHAPAPRAGAALAYDSIRRRIVLRGGSDFDSAPADTWEYDGVDWTQRPESSSPGAYGSVSMAYDPARGKTVVTGSRTNTSYEEELWEYDGAGWTSHAPVTRYPWLPGSTVAFDPTVGGVSSFDGRSECFWSWGGDDWSQLPFTNGPPARDYGSLVLDPGRDRLVLFGGDGFTGELDDLWEWDGVSWTGPGPVGPSARARHGAFYDDRLGQMVIVGGANGSTIFPETWTWDGSTWAQPPESSSTPALAEHCVAWDPDRQRGLLFGGENPRLSPWDGTWEWGPAGWTPISTNTRPPARQGCGLVYDSVRRAFVLFGGSRYNDPLGDTWEFRASTPGRATAAGHLLGFAVSRRLIQGLPSGTLIAEHTGAGRGDPDGDSVFDVGLALKVWNPAESRWVALASQTALETDDPTVQTAGGSTAGWIVDARAPDQVWLLAAAPASGPSSPGLPSRVVSDWARIVLEVELP